MMSALRSQALLSSLLLFAGACADGVEAPGGPPPGSDLPSDPKPEPKAPVPVTLDPAGPSPLDPGPEPVEPPSRARRRMDIDQLDRAIRVVSGGLGWTETRNGVEVNLFTELASTLGKPDFINSTDEDLEPSAMFQKFLDDAARSVCDRLVRVDGARDPASRALFIEANPDHAFTGAPEAATRNLAALLLRFHARPVEAGAPELEPWVWLLRTAEHVARGDARIAWRTVCVGLMTHPDFYTY